MKEIDMDRDQYGREIDEGARREAIDEAKRLRDELDALGEMHRFEKDQEHRREFDTRRRYPWRFE